MRQASPIPIELIATGNAFDFVEPERTHAYNHVHADGRWHDQLLQQAAEQIDYISLHALPVNDLFLENHTDEQAHNAVLAQVVSWEQQSIPDLLARCDRATQASKPKHIRLAITEWGPLGLHPNRLMVENFGAVVYVGSFLNMMIRNSERVPIANTTGFMHGGCIRKAYGVVYYDPQYLAVQQYKPFIGKIPVACHLTGPGYDAPKPADIGTAQNDVPWIDAVVCKEETGEGLVAAIVNRSLNQTHRVDVEIPGYSLPNEIEVNTMAHPDIAARATPVYYEIFHPQQSRITPTNGTISLSLPPFSTTWLRL
jgi:alpha-N-arabinofuranosidase